MKIMKIMNHSLIFKVIHGDFMLIQYVVLVLFPTAGRDTDPHHGDGDHAIGLVGKEDFGQKLHHICILLARTVA